MKIALLVDDFDVPQWTYAVIQHIRSSERLTLVVVVVPDQHNHDVSHPRRPLAYRLFRYLDRFFFKTKPDAFARRPLVWEKTTPVIPARIQRAGMKNTFSEEGVVRIKSYQPDVILRFGFGIVSGAILTAAPYGVWSLHHDDNDVIRGGPPGFWEWFRKDLVTGVTLQRLNETLDGGEVVSKAFTATDFTSLIRNQNRVFWKGVDLLTTALEKLAEEGGTTASVNRDVSFYSEILYRDPNTWQSCAAFFKLLTRTIRRTWSRWVGFNQWCIFFRISKSSPSFTLRNFRKLTPPRDRFWADPFVVSRDSKHFLFVEEFFYNRGKGQISCLVLDEQGAVISEARPVVKTPDHLSYPFVFEMDNKFWMIPESAERKTVDLYECTEFPWNWEFRKTLMSGVEAFDSTLHHHDGCWWLFQTRCAYPGLSAHDTLHLYFTDNLMDGTWTPHPQNPVLSDPRGARPAGKIFVHQGNLFRPSQCCVPRYGYGMYLNRIVTLSTTEYKEEKVSEILPAWNKRLRSTHTLNFNSQITVVDGQVRRSAI